MSKSFDYHAVALLDLYTSAGKIIAVRVVRHAQRGNRPVIKKSREPKTLGGGGNVRIEVSQVRLCWKTQTNAMYQVQHRSELTTNLWTDLGGALPGNGMVNCITDEAAHPNRYYRVLALP